MNAALRKKYLLIIGSVAIVLFLLLREMNGYGDMAPWSTQNSFALTVFSFLDLTKYPPSLMFALMTLGPAIVALAFLEKPLNWLGKWIIPIGRVPLFFYVLHLFLLHGLAMVALEISGRSWRDMVLVGLANSIDSPWLRGYGFSLAGTYVVWIVVVLLLYPLCKWYDNYKMNHKEKWWLSYL
jgi:hypothetical protein